MRLEDEVADGQHQAVRADDDAGALPLRAQVLDGAAIGIDEGFDAHHRRGEVIDGRGGLGVDGNGIDVQRQGGNQRGACATRGRTGNRRPGIRHEGTHGRAGPKRPASRFATTLCPFCAFRHHRDGLVVAERPHAYSLGLLPGQALVAALRVDDALQPHGGGACDPQRHRLAPRAGELVLGRRPHDVAAIAVGDDEARSPPAAPRGESRAPRRRTAGRRTRGTPATSGRRGSPPGTI